MLEIIFIGLIGLCIGSFLNVLIDRLGGEDTGLKGLGGRSHCDHCKHQLAWIDLIPVVSYVLSGGRCRYCKKKVSIYYPVIELLTSGVFAFTAIYYPSPLVTQIALLGIFSSIIVIFFADLKYHIIPDEATVALIISSLVLNYYAGTIPMNLVAGLALTLTIYFLYFATKGRGMGFGDVKLAFGMGFLLGLTGGFLALYIAFVSGGVIGLALLLLKRKGLKSKLPFGPFLVLGTVTMLLAGEPITVFFKGLFGI